jgi:acetyltransferase-like isoleucine patch superfamily enzyme
MLSLRKIQKGIKLLFDLNVINLVWFNIIKRHGGLFLPGKNGYFNIHKTAKIVIEKGGIFSFNKGLKKEPFKGYLMMEEGSKLIVHGNFSILPGARVLVTKNATLELGSGYINNNALIYCSKNIKIGNKVAISLNFDIRDTDSHEIIEENYNSTAAIEIGDHVWVGTNVTVLKGTKIGDGVVIGSRTLINRNIPPNVLVVGVPGKIKKENIEWK